MGWPDAYAAITLWNAVYLERATELLAKSRAFNPAQLSHVSPLGWEHINPTDDYIWHTNIRVAKGGFRPLRIPRESPRVACGVCKCHFLSLISYPKSLRLPRATVVWMA